MQWNAPPFDYTKVLGVNQSGGNGGSPSPNPDPDPDPTPDPTPDPVPTLRNAIDKERTMNVLNELTDSFSERIAGLMPDVIDRINRQFRFNKDLWDAVRGSSTEGLGADWNGLYVEEFESDPDGDFTMEVTARVWRLNAARRNFGTSNFRTGLIIPRFAWREDQNDDLTDDQLSGILLHEMLHPMFTFTWNQSAVSSLDADGTLDNTFFPLAYEEYIDALGLTDEEANDVLLLQPTRCNGTAGALNDGTSWLHWSRDTRTVDGTTYLGVVNDCMRTCFNSTAGNLDSPEDWIITPLSLAAGRDLGYELADGADTDAEGALVTRTVRGSDAGDIRYTSAKAIYMN